MAIPTFVHELDDHPISAIDLEQILRAARGLPRKKGPRSWHGIVVTDPILKGNLRDELQQQWGHWKLDLGERKPLLVDQAVRAIDTAPVAVLLLAAESSDASIPPEELALGVGRSILTAGRMLGTEGTLFPLPYQFESTLRRVFGLPVAWEPVGLVTLGYPSNTKLVNTDPLSDAFGENRLKKSPPAWQSPEQVRQVGKRRRWRPDSTAEATSLFEAGHIAQLMLGPLERSAQPELVAKAQDLVDGIRAAESAAVRKDAGESLSRRTGPKG
jgi:nitroreductase